MLDWSHCLEHGILYTNYNYRCCVFSPLKITHTRDGRLPSIDDHKPRVRAVLRTLVIPMCTQSTITDQAFDHLSALTTLEMSGCEQVTITDRAFAKLGSLCTLDISRCRQETITDRAFETLSNLRQLEMWSCDQMSITWRAFSSLTNLTSLDISGCDQDDVSDALVWPSDADHVRLLSIDNHRCCICTFVEAAYAEYVRM